jgi:hypothetical protein
MNNLDTLWAYIKKQVPPGGIAGGDDDRQYRDLQQFYEAKLLRATAEEKQQVRAGINDSLELCGLKPDGCDLSQQGKSKELAVAAHLLAMSIIKSCDYQALQKRKEFLDSYAKLPLGALNEALKIMLTKGDLVESERFPKLELKNFGSATPRNGDKSSSVTSSSQFDHH